MLSNRAKWVKPMEIYGLLRIFGGNIVASEGTDRLLTTGIANSALFSLGEEWKRHKKIASPAFAEVNRGILNLHLLAWLTAL